MLQWCGVCGVGGFLYLCAPTLLRCAKRRERERERNRRGGAGGGGGDRFAADSSNRIAKRGCPCYFLHCTFHPIYTEIRITRIDQHACE